MQSINTHNPFIHSSVYPSNHLPNKVKKHRFNYSRMHLIYTTPCYRIQSYTDFNTDTRSYKLTT